MTGLKAWACQAGEIWNGRSPPDSAIRLCRPERRVCATIPAIRPSAGRRQGSTLMRHSRPPLADGQVSGYRPFNSAPTPGVSGIGCYRISLRRVSMRRKIPSQRAGTGKCPPKRLRACYSGSAPGAQRGRVRYTPLSEPIPEEASKKRSTWWSSTRQMSKPCCAQSKGL
jgi:hypothetical protein